MLLSLVFTVVLEFLCTKYIQISCLSVCSTEQLEKNSESNSIYINVLKKIGGALGVSLTLSAPV